jgi:hypothetical protein
MMRRAPAVFLAAIACATLARDARMACAADAAATTTTAPAADATPWRTRVLAAIAQLHAPTWAERQAADETLLRQPPAARVLVEQALSADADPETRGRLESIALHLYLKEQTPTTGAASILGITLPPLAPDPDAQAPGSIMVVSVLPGFNAAEVLKPGDLILAIDGEALPPRTSAETFRDLVNPRPPNGPLHLRIKREGQVMTVDVQPAGIDEPGLDELMQFSQQRAALAKAYLQDLQTRMAPHGTVVGTAPPAPARPRVRATGDYQIVQPRLPGQ